MPYRDKARKAEYMRVYHQKRRQGLGSSIGSTEGLTGSNLGSNEGLGSTELIIDRVSPAYFLYGDMPLDTVYDDLKKKYGAGWKDKWQATLNVSFA